MTTPFISIISPSGFRDILNLNLSGRTIAPLIRMEPSPALGPSTGKIASRLNSPSKEKLLTCCMACALHEETVAASSSMPPGKQSAGRSISPSILDMGSIGAVAVGAGVGVGVGIGVGVAVDIGVGMAVGVGVGVAVGIGVGMTVGMEVGSAVGAGSVGVGSLPQATSTADARAIAITRQSTFFTLDPVDQMIRFLSKLMRFRHSDSTMPV